MLKRRVPALAIQSRYCVYLVLIVFTLSSCGLINWINKYMLFSCKSVVVATTSARYAQPTTLNAPSASGTGQKNMSVSTTVQPSILPVTCSRSTTRSPRRAVVCRATPSAASATDRRMSTAVGARTAKSIWTTWWNMSEMMRNYWPTTASVPTTRSVALCGVYAT